MGAAFAVEAPAKLRSANSGTKSSLKDRQSGSTSFLYRIVAASSSRSPQVSGKQLLPWLVAVAFFMEALDTTILNTARLSV